MSNTNINPLVSSDVSATSDDASFADILSSFEQQHREEKRGETIIGTVVSVGPENILVDIGRKIEGSLLIAKWQEREEGEPQRGMQIPVSVGPRNAEGYYDLSTMRVERPKDWTGLQAALAGKQNIAGTVVEQVKGGFRVDIGIRAFLPASRSGVREAEDMPKLVGQEIQCRITKLDVDKEDVVVDRRVVLEEEQAQRRQQAFSGLKEGATVRGTVRNVMDFGAFVDLGGIDGLLHVMDMSYTRLSKAADAVKVGDEIEVKILKIDPVAKKISLGLKQLQEEPWSIAVRTLTVGDRVSGTVSRLTDFGAFVELLPGVDGLVHLSELSWDKRVRKPSDLLKVGDRVDVVVLQINPEDRKVGLGYKQVLGDPWDAVPQKFPVGSVIEGPITNVAAFGGFVDLGDGIEGMVHISDITNEKRLDHPKDKLVKGQPVKAVVLELDRERRRIRLGMRQLEPTTVDHYIAEHRAGETVSGRLVEIHGSKARVELAEGVIGTCTVKSPETKPVESRQPKTTDVKSLSEMLSAKWKQGGGEGSSSAKPTARAGEIHTFRISALDSSRRLIELELAT